MCAIAAALLAQPAQADSPETVEGLGPKDGEWSLEYAGQFGSANGSDVGRDHSGQSFYGVTDGLAIGGETQLSYRSGPLVDDRVYFDYDSVVAIFPPWQFSLGATNNLLSLVDCAIGFFRYVRAFPRRQATAHQTHMSGGRLVMVDEIEKDDFDDWAIGFHDFYPANSRLDAEFRTSRLLVLASRSWTYRVDAALRNETGHSRSRWQVLFALAFAKQPATMTDIAKRARVKWSTLLRATQQMEREGIISLESNPEDGRSKLVRLTAAGEAVIESLQPILDRERSALLDSFTSDELRTCERMLRIVFEAAIRPRT